MLRDIQMCSDFLLKKIKDTHRWVVAMWVSPYKSRAGVMGLCEVYTGVL